MTQSELVKVTAQIVVLKEVAETYGGKMIDNIIMQLEARRKEVTK